MYNNESKSLIPTERIERTIYVIRGHKVILDQDLAVLYGVETKALNQAVQRNINRFPEDFAFQLSQKEWENLRSQFVTSSFNYGGRRYFPYAFTEQGVAMLSSVLRSPQAVLVNIEIIRAFIRLRQTLSSYTEINKELTDLKSFLLKHSHSNDREFKKVWNAIEKMTKSSEIKTEDQPRIGFNLNYG